MATGTQFNPNASDKIIDTTTGQFTEIGRILLRELAAAVGGLAPITAAYWVSHSDGTLSGEQNLGSLTSGYLKLTTAIGIATPSTVTAIPLADVATLSAGTYTPTLFNVANVTASTAFVCQYLRVGATVTVSGRVDVDPTAAVDTQLGISLPIASNFANSFDCAGTGASPAVAGQSAAVLGDTVNDRAVLQWLAVDLANRPMYFTFSYRVI